MTPAEKAAVVYTVEPCARTFEQDLALHLLNGYVYSSPEYFVLARPVWAGAPEEEILDPECVWPVEVCNCWWIYLFSGDLAEAVKLFPFRLALIGWERENKPRLYDFEKGIRKVSKVIKR
jgi:hypothetical protein